MNIFTRLWDDLRGLDKEPGVTEILSKLPKNVDPVQFVQLAVTVLAKTSLVVADTEAAVAAEGLNIQLDMQDIQDIQALLEAAGNIFEAFSGELLSTTAPVAAH